LISSRLRAASLLFAYRWLRLKEEVLGSAARQIDVTNAVYMVDQRAFPVRVFSGDIGVSLCCGFPGCERWKAGRTWGFFAGPLVAVSTGTSSP